MLFYCNQVLHATWIRSTYLELEALGFRCAIVTESRHPIPLLPGARTYRGSASLLRRLNAPVLVTAVSGVPRERLHQNVRFHVHMPHSLVSLHMAYPEGAFDGYDLIFACGEHHIAEVVALRRLRPHWRATALPVGYGKSDELRRELRALKLPDSKRRPHVVVAPSWGERNLLDSLGLELVRELLECGYDVTVRPHPGGVANAARVCSLLRERYGNCDRFRLELPTAGSGSLLDADLMISDYSGVALEYAFLRELPVLYVDVPHKAFNNDWNSVGLVPLELSVREVVGKVVAAETHAILSGARELLASSQRFVQAIRVARSKYCFNYGTCGKSAARAIGDLLSDASVF